MPDYAIPYDPKSGQPVTETQGVSRKNFYGLTGRDFMKSRDDNGHAGHRSRFQQQAAPAQRHPLRALGDRLRRHQSG